MTAKIEIYGTSSCKKCVDVRAFLDSKNIEYIDYLIDLMPLEKDDMIRRSGLKYYPQIFINEKQFGSNFSDSKIILISLGNIATEVSKYV